MFVFDCQYSIKLKCEEIANAKTTLWRIVLWREHATELHKAGQFIHLSKAHDKHAALNRHTSVST